MSEHGDPLVGFHFSIDIQGKVAGFFTEVSGLGSEHEIIKKPLVVDGKQIIKMIPGGMKWENIVLKRGITGSMDVWQWRAEVENGNVETARRNGSVTMYNQEGTPMARWDFERGWPAKVTGPQPKADSNEIGIEELTVAHEGIRRVEV